MTDMLNALIVDDEQLAREELKELLSEYQSIRIIGEANSVDSAIAAIEELRPDIIFLDIQMPGKTGFDLVNEIETDADIIFVTAYDEYAIRAFEINAVDYLMKPIYPARLKKTIDRITTKVKPESLPNEKLKNDDYIFFNIKNRSKFILVDSIICITACKEYTEVSATDGIKGLIYKPMQEWERRLPEQNFIRIHRSFIINLKYVEKLEPSKNNAYNVYMKGVKDPFTMSRRYAVKLKKIFL